MLLQHRGQYVLHVDPLRPNNFFRQFELVSSFQEDIIPRCAFLLLREMLLVRQRTGSIVLAQSRNIVLVAPTNR
jgi:hypothetical protein